MGSRLRRCVAWLCIPSPPRMNTTQTHLLMTSLTRRSVFSAQTSCLRTTRFRVVATKTWFTWQRSSRNALSKCWDTRHLTRRRRLSTKLSQMLKHTRWASRNSSWTSLVFSMLPTVRGPSSKNCQPILKKWPQSAPSAFLSTFTDQSRETWIVNSGLPWANVHSWVRNSLTNNTKIEIDAKKLGKNKANTAI